MIFFFNTLSYGFVCGGNSSSALHTDQSANSSNTLQLNASSLKNPNNWVTDFGASKYLISSSLITCSGYASGSTTGDAKLAKFYTFENSNIKEDYVWHGLYQYYKIKGTSNDFLDNNAYIAFWYMDNRDSPSRYFLSSTGVPIQNISNPSYTQGMKFNEFRILFTVAPTEPITNVPVKIGTLEMQIKEKGTENLATAKQAVQIYLNVSPILLKTCEVSNQTVNLPIVKTTDFTNSEAGSKDFKLTAKCPGYGLNGALQDRELTAIITDNYDIYNTSFILSNNNKDSNVGIKIQDADLNRAVYSGQEFKFGTISSTVIDKSVTKNFKASYYVNDNKPAKAGTVNSEAIISVTYP